MAKARGRSSPYSCAAATEWSVPSVRGRLVEAAIRVTSRILDRPPIAAMRILTSSPFIALPNRALTP
ncbi:hypothetical protein GCM10009736_11190 [Actinomadura bangladeshensis]